MLFLLYKLADDAVFDESPKSSDHFPKISEDFPKLFRRSDGRFWTFSQRFSEDCRRRPKKIRRCFDRTPTNLTNSTKPKVGNNDVIERYDTHKVACELRRIFSVTCSASFYVVIFGGTSDRENTSSAEPVTEKIRLRSQTTP